MSNIDLVELANFCQRRNQEKYNSDNKYYIGTIFVAITEDGSVLTSTTYHILKNAEQCILIHKRRELAIKYYYFWYDVEYINKEGQVLENRLDDNFILKIGACNGFDNQIMFLRYEDNPINSSLEVYSCREPWEKNIVKVWNLYTRVKDIQSAKEIKLIADLFKKDEQILALEKQIEDFTFTNYQLEQERNQYKDLLEDIKEIISEK